MNELFPKPKLEFDIGNNKKYKVEAIKDSAIYAKKAKKHLPSFFIWFPRKATYKKKHLETFFYSHKFSENDLNILQKLFGKANSNFSSP